MNIARLRLIAYGPFTGQECDFTARPRALHLVYGPNEAGKSSALRALRAAFFEIENRTTDNFVHDYLKLRIGLDLVDEDGNEHSFVRRKGNKATLRDGRDVSEVPSARLERLLGGLTLQQFNAMFGLRQVELAKASDEMAEGKGELGELLFAAGAGLGELHAVLAQLDKDCRELYLPTGVKPALNAALKLYRDAKTSQKSAALKPAEWTRKSEELAAAEVKAKSLDAELGQLMAKKSRLERWLEARPDAAELQQVRAAQRELLGVRRLADDFGKRRTEINQALAVANRLLQAKSTALADLDDQLNSLPFHGVEPRLEALYEQLANQQTVAELARRDLPNVKVKRDERLSKVRAALSRLRPDGSLDDASSLRLSREHERQVRDLSDQRHQLTGQLNAAEQELQSSRERLAQTQDELGVLPVPRDVARLEAALDLASHAETVQSQYQQMQEETERLRRQMQGELARLNYWSGGLAELETRPLPSLDGIERFDRQLAALQKNAAEVNRRRQEETERLARATSDLQSLELDGDVPTEASLNQARARREQLWLELRERALAGRPWEASAPSSFERSVAQADDVADRLRREADRVANKTTLQVAINDATTRLHELDEAMRRSEDDLAAFHVTWQAAWPGLDIGAADPQEMRGWLVVRDKILGAAASLRTHEHNRRSIEQKLDSWRQRIANELAALSGPDAPGDLSLVEIIALAKREVAMSRERFAAREGRTQDVNRATAAVVRAEARLARLQNELTAWQARWAATVEQIGLAPDATTEQAADWLDDMKAIAGDLAAANDETARIEAMQSSLGAFEALVAEGRALLGLPADGTFASQGIVERLKVAHDAQRERKKLVERREKATQDVQQARNDLMRAEAALEALVVEAGCSTAEELDRIEEQSRRARESDARLKELTTRLTRTARGEDIDVFVGQALEVAGDSLCGDIDQVARELERLQQDYGSAREAHGMLKRDLDAYQGQMPAAQCAETVERRRAELIGHAEQYARLRIAWAVLGRSMERYRKQNEGPVLAKAGRLFSRLTTGAFTGLLPDRDGDDRPILVGERRGGEVVPIAGMSDGSRDQLFLALRLASIDHYLDSHEPVPLVVDDICIQFDDERTSATLATLGELSEKTQVIFFTHHEHLIDLAKKAVPAESLVVHRMTGKVQA